MGADFRAFQRYMDTDWDTDRVITRIPASPGAPFSNFLIINSTPIHRGFMDDTISDAALMAQRGDAVAALNTHMVTQPGAMTGGKQEVYEEARAAITAPYAMTESGGGFAAHRYGVMVFNEQVGTLSDIADLALRKDAPDASAQDNAHYAVFKRHHEAAHGMLDLGEAGSDFMAAALTLRENRGSDNMLSIVADLRNVQALQTPEASAYTTTCSEAIQYVRAMNPDELRSMSTRDLYAIAQRFDRTNAEYANNPHSADNTVRDALTDTPLHGFLEGIANITPWFAENFRNGARYAAEIELQPVQAQEKLDNLPLREGSTADRLRDRLEDSYERLNRGAPAP